MKDLTLDAMPEAFEWRSRKEMVQARIAALLKKDGNKKVISSKVKTAKEERIADENTEKPVKDNNSY